MLPALERLVAEWRPELVLRDPCEHASALVAARAGVAHAQVAISLAAVEWSSLALAEPALARFDAALAAAERAAPYLTRFPASLDPSPFPRTVRVREEAGAGCTGAGGLPDWAARDAALPLVYATLGSEAGRVIGDAAGHRTLAQAFAGLPVRVLLSTGRDVDPAALGPLPPNVDARRWAPQAEAMASAALVVCHGGSGTVLGALAAGLPLVVLPLFADQPRNARLVAQAGAGLVVEGDRHDGAAAALPSADRIRAAVEQALATPSLRTAAARVAAEQRGAPTTAEALDSLTAY
jgi:UDP:flavonoid glycosyltransferase YjiC (YdhE family)